MNYRDSKFWSTWILFERSRHFWDFTWWTSFEYLECLVLCHIYNFHVHNFHIYNGPRENNNNWNKSYWLDNCWNAMDHLTSWGLWYNEFNKPIKSHKEIFQSSDQISSLWSCWRNGKKWHIYIAMVVYRFIPSGSDTTSFKNKCEIDDTFMVI